MNSYLLSLFCLFLATLANLLVGGFALKFSLQRDLPTERWRMWIAFSIGTLFLALHHGRTLHLAAQTGLYDFRQAIVAMLGGLAIAYAMRQLRRLQP